MSETSTVNNEIEIKILGKDGSIFGSKVEDKREPLRSLIKTVTSENWSHSFPNTPLAPDKKKEIDEGSFYLKVAVDSQSGTVAGSIKVRHPHNNALSVEVSEEYQRRGVASALIKQAQTEHDSLHLLNFVGKAGETLYIKMGFKKKGGVDHFVWKKNA